MTLSARRIRASTTTSNPRPARPRIVNLRTTEASRALRQMQWGSRLVADRAGIYIMARRLRFSKLPQGPAARPDYLAAKSVAAARQRARLASRLRRAVVA